MIISILLPIERLAAMMNGLENIKASLLVAESFEEACNLGDEGEKLADDIQLLRQQMWN